MNLITIVIPVYNEAPGITERLNEILIHCRDIADTRFNILVVDDGSTDDLKSALDRDFDLGNAVHYLRLNSNFGKEDAIFAGLSVLHKSDAAIVMDCDLQHPPVLVKDMIERWRQGHDVVEACKRSRGEEAAFKGFLVKLFYTAFDRFTGLNIRNQSDFKLLDKKVVDFYCGLPERDRFFRGLVNWMQFDSAQLYFDVPEVAHKESTWSRWQLFKYAVYSIASFTSTPLQIVTLFGLLTFVFSLGIGSVALFDKFSGNAVDGFTTVILLILIIGSVLMFSLGLIGVYLARIYDEVKGRPSFIINRDMTRFDENEL